jgi:hypothetical protein
MIQLQTRIASGLTRTVLGRMTIMREVKKITPALVMTAINPMT